MQVSLINTRTHASIWPRNVYKSTHKHFVMTTKVVEQKYSLTIHRTVHWYDSKRKIYRKRKEVQIYDCEDFTEENLDSDTYDDEFNIYNDPIHTKYIRLNVD